MSIMCYHEVPHTESLIFKTVNQNLAFRNDNDVFNLAETFPADPSVFITQVVEAAAG